jgi:predicted DNA-binding protein
MADGSKTRSARLPDELNSQVEQYTEQQGMTNSEALRHLIRAGLEAETEDGRRLTKLEDSLARIAEGMAVAVFAIVAVYVAGVLPLGATLKAAAVMAIPAALLAGALWFDVLDRAGGSAPSSQEVAE